MKTFPFLVYKSRMPRGGKRPNSGRPPGSRNKRNQEREHRKLQAVARQHGAELPGLAKDLIEEFMQQAAAYARHYALSKQDLEFADQDKVQNKRDWKRAQFKTWARLAVSWAADLAPYQSPTYRAISIATKEDDQVDRGTTVIHTIEDLRAQLMLHGVSPDQLGRALLEQEQQMLEHENDGSDSEPESPERD